MAQYTFQVDYKLAHDTCDGDLHTTDSWTVDTDCARQTLERQVKQCIQLDQDFHKGCRIVDIEIDESELCTDEERKVAEQCLKAGLNAITTNKIAFR